MSHIKSSDLASAFLSPSCSSESLSSPPSFSESSTTTSKSTAKSRPAPGLNQDEAAPLKRARPDMTPEAPNTASAPKNLDEEVFLCVSHSFAANRLMNMEPDLSLLLSFITTKDSRLATLTADQAEELLKLDPLIKDTLRIAWQNDSYQNLLQLGMFPIQNMCY